MVRSTRPPENGANRRIVSKASGGGTTPHQRPHIIRVDKRSIPPSYVQKRKTKLKNRQNEGIDMDGRSFRSWVSSVVSGRKEATTELLVQNIHTVVQVTQNQQTIPLVISCSDVSSGKQELFLWHCPLSCRNCRTGKLPEHRARNQLIIATIFSKDTREERGHDRDLDETDTLHIYLQNQILINAIKSGNVLRKLTDLLKVQFILNQTQIAALFRAASIAQRLASNTTLTSLHLGSNEIKAAGAASIAQRLASNTTLTSLNLITNDIEAAGAASIAQRLASNTTNAKLKINI
ncbi:hypothetical protein PROFUN_04315 [Planoprotostelium fungivorum]|uniref:Uncharacterized protein n=1 Tax=Planoprotostelium fungivorum TaxID=1890364 RepID=A0A2P6NV42_9EUKA|nr:hypothetical protein PROFUN_04315 [Planoprotostelium fungivorum]